jgi:hypothetical protein
MVSSDVEVVLGKEINTPYRGGPRFFRHQKNNTWHRISVVGEIARWDNNNNRWELVDTGCDPRGTRWHLHFRCTSTRGLEAGI